MAFQNQNQVTRQQQSATSLQISRATLDEKCGMVFEQLNEVGHHATTISNFQATNSMITCRQLQTRLAIHYILMNGSGLQLPAQMHLKMLIENRYFNTTNSAKRFINDLDFTCKELQTMTSYTNYIDKFHLKLHVRRLRSSIKQLQILFAENVKSIG